MAVRLGRQGHRPIVFGHPMTLSSLLAKVVTVDRLAEGWA